ncbi:MAG: hypothetical protein WB774_06320 [Xanthobacteraceae bacterium]
MRGFATIEHAVVAHNANMSQSCPFAQFDGFRKSIGIGLSFPGDHQNEVAGRQHGIIDIPTDETGSGAIKAEIRRDLCCGRRFAQGAWFLDIDEGYSRAFAGLGLVETLLLDDLPLRNTRVMGDLADAQMIILAGLGMAVENRFGLHPAAESDGSPAAIETESPIDRLHLLRGVDTFNLHPHLPQFERLHGAAAKLDVLVRQKIDLTAPPHFFTRNGRTTFDALLQSRPDTFARNLFVGDATLWSSTAGGVDSLRQLWTNVAERPKRPCSRNIEKFFRS